MYTKILVVFLVCILAGICLGQAYISPIFAIISPIAFLPLLYANEASQESRWGTLLFLVMVYFWALSWHLSSTFWLFNAFFIGPLLLNLINPFFYTLIWFAFRITYKRHKPLSYLLLISLWLSFEYFQLNWDFSFILLHIGNILGTLPQLAQWYEYTGVLGGSLFLLCINILVYNSLNKRKLIWLLSAVLVIPSTFSLCNYFTSNDENLKKIEVVAIHPNMDCRNERKENTDEWKTKKYTELILQKVTKKTSLVLLPEMAFFETQFIEYISTWRIKLMYDSLLLVQHPNLNIITGCSLAENCLDTNLAKKEGILFNRMSNGFPYFQYNGIAGINREGIIGVRSKQKLVPIEETIPYPSKISGVRNLIPSLGGFYFCAKPNEKAVFDINDSIKICPLVCYESGFGEFVAMQSEKATLLTISLNEGWYKHVTGATMFQNMARLRAIETRKYILKSSNDGISSIISNKGDIVIEMKDFKADATSGKVSLCEKTTFYAEHGDWIGILALYSLVACVLLCSSIQKNKNNCHFYLITVITFACSSLMKR